MRLNPLRAKLASNMGTAAIEFAIVAPMIAAALIATVETGFTIHATIQAQEAASAGALFASQNGWNAAGIAGAVTAAVDEPGVNASPAPREFWGCPETGGVASANEGAICPDGSEARPYAEVGASLARRSILPSNLGLPAVVTARSTVRLP